MKILVTGARGFIGKRLCAALAGEGYEVIPFDLAEGDLTKPDALANVPAADMVYHLAAVVFVPKSWEDPYTCFHINLMATVTVLEFCRRTKARLVMMSTYIYGEPQYLPVDERHPIRPVSPYHQSKILAEQLCGYYHEVFGVDVLVCRPFNLYGYGQDPAFLLPKIMRQALDPEQKEIVVFNLSPRRDYIYVDDVIRALVLACGRVQGFQTVNIATGVSVSVREAIETILRVTGQNKPYRETGEARSREISDCYADCSTAERLLGFRARYDLAAGVAAWLKELPGS